MTTQDVFMFVDETGIDEESKILAITCIVTREPEHIRKALTKLKQELVKKKGLKDLPSIQNLEKKGFHYCEDHKDVRSKVIDLIAILPFEAYICYRCKVHNFCPSDGFEWYDQLFGKLMHNRLRKYQSPVSISFEQHGKSFKNREKELEDIIKRIVHQIEREDAVKFHHIPVIKSAGKEESCLAVSDYIAAIFKDYEEALIKVGNEIQNNSGSWQARNFSILRPKIRLIHDYDNNKFFSRHNPFP